MVKFQKERIYYIDWLRVLAILAVFLFHCSHIFDTMDFHVKNKETSEICLIFVASCNFWMMPLFFLLAGASSQFASKVRSSGQYVYERFKRLVIPFIIGVIVLVPPQFYVEALQKGHFSGNYIKFFSHNMEVLTKYWQPSPVYFGSIGHHVWFLAFLFIYSVITIPIFRFLSSNKGQKIIEIFAGICSKPGRIYIFALPPALVYLVLKPISPSYNDWADFFNWLLVFIFGFIIYSRKEFTHAIAKHTYPALAASLVSLAACLGFLASGPDIKWYNVPDYSLGCMVFYLLWVINTWSWMFFFLGIGSKILNFKNSLLAYTSEAVLPFYLLHQTVLLVVGYFVVKWNTGILIKFLVIAISSFSLTIGLYEFLVRRFQFIRLIFGMKPKKSTKTIPLLKKM